LSGIDFSSFVSLSHLKPFSFLLSSVFPGEVSQVWMGDRPFGATVPDPDQSDDFSLSFEDSSYRFFLFPSSPDSRVFSFRPSKESYTVARQISIIRDKFFFSYGTEGSGWIPPPPPPSMSVPEITGSFLSLHGSADLRRTGPNVFPFFPPSSPDHFFPLRLFAFSPPSVRNTPFLFYSIRAWRILFLPPFVFCLTPLLVGLQGKSPSSPQKA